MCSIPRPVFSKTSFCLSYIASQSEDDKMIRSRFAATTATGIMINRRDKKLVDIPICPDALAKRLG